MANPTTVLQVRNSIAFGGVETTLLGWLDNIDRKRFNCPVCLFQERDGREIALRKPLTKHGHEIIDLPWWPGRQFFKAVKQLSELIRETDAKLLHTHDWRSDVVGYYAAKKTGIPIMTTIYVWFNSPLHICIKEKIDSLFIRHFDLVTAVCEATRKQTVARGVAEEKTKVLLSGISEKRRPNEVDRNTIRSHFGISPDDIAFVFVARLYPEKAHVCLINAFRTAQDKKSNLKLLLLGNGPLKSEIKMQAKRLGLSKSVIIPGFVDNVPEVLKSMDCLIHASLAEGIPLAVYEGMLSGLPVVGSDVDGTAEVVIPDKTGWIVPPNDSSQLANAIIEAAERDDLRKLYGKQAKELILTHYNIDIAVEKLLSTYERLIAKGKP